MISILNYARIKFFLHIKFEGLLGAGLAKARQYPDVCGRSQFTFDRCQLY
jgi:hypothetical protein